MPCCSTAAATSTMKAPAGPPIWKRLPPSSRNQEAADDRRCRGPVSGVAREPMAIAIDSGSATIATVRPAMTSAWKLAKL